MDSVGRAAKANLLLIVECGHCYHVGRFRANDVAKVVGWNKPVETINVKCKRCSRKDATVRTQFNIRTIRATQVESASPRPSATPYETRKRASLKPESS